ncbi:T9SS type B sorting domain-containing protein [Maribacter sp. Asnod1-A12]|uniref:T9SS type B sorting domain-containing protein n=1 Tax=Maribacter sp. Asnod1-A12 TaxID=3160576 RepID=UPI00386EA2BF
MKVLLIITISLYSIILRSQDLTENWVGSNYFMQATACDIRITTAVSNLTNDADVYFYSGQMGCTTESYSSNRIINHNALAPFLEFGNNGKGILTFNFNQTVTNPILHIDRLGGGYGPGPFSNSALLTLLNTNSYLNRLSGNGEHFEVTSNTITRTPNQPFGSNTTSECGLADEGGAAGSVQIMGSFNSISFEFELNGSTGDADVVEIVWEIICDFDEDGIDDRTDLDDDNDGILDSIELGSNPLLDSDNDGLIDSRDIDSDGDGCFDVTEAGFTDLDDDGVLGSLPNNVDPNGMIINTVDGYTPPLVSSTNNTFYFQYHNGPTILQQPVNKEICAGEDTFLLIETENANTIQWQYSNDNGTSWYNIINNETFDGANTNELEIKNSDQNLNGFEFRAAMSFCSNLTISNSAILYVYKKPNAGEDNQVEFHPTDPIVNLIDYLGGNPDENGTWSPALNSNSGIFNPENENEGFYTYTVTNGTCQSSEAILEVSLLEIDWDDYRDFDQDGIVNNLDLDDDNDGILDSIELGNDLLLDSDMDGQIDSQDLDSDNDGCFDVVEAGFTDLDYDGILGDFPNDVDNNGRITNEIDGYTTPIYSNENNAFDFQLQNIPTITQHPNNVEICEGLNTTISVQIANAKTFQWQYKPPNETNWVSLQNDDTYNGIYTNTLQIKNVNRNLNNYRYRVKTEFCLNAIFTESAELVILNAENAGENGFAVFCPDDNPIDLIHFLNGNPDSSGTWLPALNSNTGVFNPNIDKSGIYTYQINNFQCQSSEAIVDVEILQTPIISNIKVKDLSENNTITIELNNSGSFEFSLDNIFFQDSSTFNNLNADNYMIYVRNKNGCETITEQVSIIDYPKFFTPNNDGYNDYWNIEGLIRSPFNLTIFDRYGKLIKHINNLNNSWDGTFNNQPMPSSDYWFKFTANKTIKTGHFSLKR